MSWKKLYLAVTFSLATPLFFCLSSAEAKDISAYITAQSKHLPFPREIELKVEFWKAIYTRYTTNQGVIHDSEDLSIIYDAVQLPQHNEMGAVDAVRSDIREALFNILQKQGKGLSTFERHILSKFPSDASRARLMRATENIRFQRGQADRFKEGIIRSGYYLKHVERILKEEGVPDFLKYLPHVESSFQEFAISKFGAAGLWQLMPSSARDFKLKVEYAIDERLDPWQATRAAARHVKRDYKFLGQWSLALTAYNHGPAGVMKAVRTLGTTDIAEIAFNYESPSFGFASRNFYAQFLAAVEVASNTDRYFGELPLKKALEFETVTLDRPTYFVDFGKKYEFTLDDFKKLNPGLRNPILKNQRPIPAQYLLRVPPNSKRQILVASLDKTIGKTLPKLSVSSPQAELKASVTEKDLAKKVLIKAVPQAPSKYAVRDLIESRGWIEVEINETITQMAEWLRVPVETLREWNGMDSQGQIQQGQRILLKFEKTEVGEFTQEREDYHRQIREDFFARFEVSSTKDYVVKRGENLWTLCYQRFEIPPWLLEEYNPNVKLSALKTGLKLKIPQLNEKEFVSAVSEAGAFAE